MTQAFQSIPNQEEASGAWRGASRSIFEQFVDFARRWGVTMALISGLVVLSAIMHWSV
jgi:hypothetical protein